MSIKQALINQLKNIPGWKTRRKLVLFFVDDYGNVVVDSPKARKLLDEAGQKIHSRFDAYDTMETKEDLEVLFNTLTSVKDQHNNNAVFTPFALPCNIDFEGMDLKGNKEYIYEYLPETFDKLSQKDPQVYQGAWQLWQDGIREGLMMPQFHGREHFHLKEFTEKLIRNDPQLRISLANRSNTGIMDTSSPTISYTGAFTFWDPKETEDFHEILNSGVKAFKKVFGYSPKVFAPPTLQFPAQLEGHLTSLGIEFIDKPLFEVQHIGFGKVKKKININGTSHNGLFTVTRNAVFEPSEDRGIDWVNYTLRQIEAAFRWNKPAIISSHRVNFCGYIDKKYRASGIDALKRLLQMIVKQHPDVEFISAGQLVNIIKKDKTER